MSTTYWANTVAGLHDVATHLFRTFSACPSNVAFMTRLHKCMIYFMKINCMFEWPVATVINVNNWSKMHAQASMVCISDSNIYTPLKGCSGENVSPRNISIGISRNGLTNGLSEEDEDDLKMELAKVLFPLCLSSIAILSHSSCCQTLSYSCLINVSLRIILCKDLI